MEKRLVRLLKHRMSSKKRFVQSEQGQQTMTTLFSQAPKKFSIRLNKRYEVS